MNRRARALGLDSLVGSIEVGKQADLALLAAGGSLAAVHDPEQAVVYCTTGQEVTDVWVAGERVLACEVRTEAIDFRDELARTATGKLQKFKLRAPLRNCILRNLTTLRCSIYAGSVQKGIRPAKYTSSTFRSLIRMRCGSRPTG